MIFPPVAGEQQRSNGFRQDEKHDQPTPDQESQINVMPQSDECEDGEEVCHRPEFPDPATSQWNVNVSRDPLVETPMPAPPECKCRVVVAHTANHVFGRIDPIEEGPETKEAPGKQKLEPDDVQIEVAKHAELERTVCRPVRFGMANGNGIEVVQAKFHGEKTNDEANGVGNDSCPVDGWSWIATLRDVVVEVDDGTSEEKR